MEPQRISDPAALTIPRTTDTDLKEASRLRGRIQLDLSPAQVAGGSLAAATAAALSSSLGVAGTIAGAAVISMVTAVAGALYTHSLRRTRAHARAAAALIAVRRKGTDEQPASLRPPDADDRPAAVRPPGADERPSTVRPPARIALAPRRLIATGLVVFALAVAGITGFELLAGHPLSGGAAGTTLGEVTGTGSDADTGGSREPTPAEQQPSLDPGPFKDDEAPTSQPSEPSPSESSTESGTEPSSPSPTSPSDPAPRPTPSSESDAPR